VETSIALKPKEFGLTGTGQPTADSASLVDLYETHGERMKSIAMNLLGNTVDAEDAVQEAFLRIHRASSSFRGGSALSTWAYRILVNACYDAMRRGRRRPESPLPEDTALPRSADADTALRIAIEQALAKLERKERTAFLLCEVEGLSHREAADILDVNPNTSRTLLFRAKRKLQKELSARDAFAAAPVEGR
jgi:RNA polymerase sigma-70 factor (ECF subfamily)